MEAYRRGLPWLTERMDAEKVPSAARDPLSVRERRFMYVGVVVAGAAIFGSPFLGPKAWFGFGVGVALGLIMSGWALYIALTRLTPDERRLKDERWARAQGAPQYSPRRRQVALIAIVGGPFAMLVSTLVDGPPGGWIFGAGAVLLGGYVVVGISEVAFHLAGKLRRSLRRSA
jgi:hypothetical protein